MLVKPIKTRIFKANESLEKFILHYLPKVSDKSIIVVTSKIVALSQDRVFPTKDKVKLIKQESEQYIKTKWCYLTLKDGHWCANAGVDESNVEGGGFILWPEKPFEVAEKLRESLSKKYKVKNLGVLITDSRIFPLRVGVTGVALAYAGFGGLRNYIGEKDLFGRKLKMTQTNIADSLASAAILTMGEGAESCPLAIINEMMVKFRAKVDRHELAIDPKVDLYRPLFVGLARRRT